MNDFQTPQTISESKYLSLLLIKKGIARQINNIHTHQGENHLKIPVQGGFFRNIALFIN